MEYQNYLPLQNLTKRLETIQKTSSPDCVLQQGAHPLGVEVEAGHRHLRSGGREERILASRRPGVTGLCAQPVDNGASGKSWHVYPKQHLLVLATFVESGVEEFFAKQPAGVGYA